MMGEEESTLRRYSVGFDQGDAGAGVSPYQGQTHVDPSNHTEYPLPERRSMFVGQAFDPAVCLCRWTFPPGPGI